MTHTWNVAVHLFEPDDIMREGRITTAPAVLLRATSDDLAEIEHRPVRLHA